MTNQPTRVIKFRFYDKNINDNRISVSEQTLEDLEGGDSWQGSSPWRRIATCQFTGLTDKNGKEIYEGDIVRGGVVYDFENDGIAEVKIGEFDADSSGQEYGSVTCYGVYNEIIKSKYGDSEHGSFLPECLEVIGNVWENGNLL